MKTKIRATLISSFAFLFFLVSCNTLRHTVFTPAITLIPTKVVNMSRDDETRAGVATGYKIINALDRYYQDNQQYPEQLSDLKPKYLEEIPLTITGQPFSYSLLKSPDALYPYVLGFDLATTNLAFGCAYPGWECGPASPP